MSTHRIVCVETQHPHRHITHVGTGTDQASANERWTVQQVRDSIRAGNRFYTASPSTGRTADVEPYDYWTGTYFIYTIRSSPDAVSDNNLDNLRVCSWRS